MFHKIPDFVIYPIFYFIGPKNMVLYAIKITLTFVFKEKKISAALFVQSVYLLIIRLKWYHFTNILSEFKSKFKICWLHFILVTVYA